MQRRSLHLPTLVALGLLIVGTPASFAQTDFNNPGIYEPITSFLEGRDVRVPNTDQSIDGVQQSAVDGEFSILDARFTESLLGHPITRVSSPNEDMRLALQDIATAALGGDQSGMTTGANELLSILHGTTEGRIYDGFSMLNYNRWKNPDIGPEHFPQDAVPAEYKMKVARDTGKTFISPFDNEERKIWEVDINFLYYDGQIDSDTFLVKFPMNEAEGFHHPEDVLHVNYRVYSLEEEDFSPTLVMLDRRKTLRTVNFPFKGFDVVWIAFFPGEVLDVTVKMPPLRMLRGVYTWGWREHPPRIQFMQPVYEIIDKREATFGQTVWDPQSESFVIRNREELTVDTIAPEAPEMKMLEVAEAILGGMDTTTIVKWLTEANKGPLGTWIEWSDLVLNQTQLPPEAKQLLADEGLGEGEFGDYNMVTVFMNNEMYGDGPFLNEIKLWDQGETFLVKLHNFDRHTHYFRNVDFGARLNNDILRCCGGGETSFEIMNFKPSYGAPKVAEMQWRAGWGFRPHYDVIQQQGVFSRGQDRAKVTPYLSGDSRIATGYQYSKEARGGDFRFNPPPFVILEADNPSENLLREIDGSPGLLIGQRTEGYGTATICADDPHPGFCTKDIQDYNVNGSKNWPPPPLQGQGLCGDRPEPCELRWPPFLRNPCQDDPECGDIIPPTSAWRPFLWLSPNNGTIWNDPNDHSKGHWADFTMGHGAPIFAGGSLNATVELPRASGQVFYQFDALFHDNSVFSPHPVFAGFGDPDEVDSVTGVKARLRGDVLRVRGQVGVFATGQYADWVLVHRGAAGGSGCNGEVFAAAPVDPETGKFVLRQAGSGVAAGDDICVASTIGGFSAGKAK